MFDFMVPTQKYRFLPQFQCSIRIYERATNYGNEGQLIKNELARFVNIDRYPGNGRKYAIFFPI